MAEITIPVRVLILKDSISDFLSLLSKLEPNTSGYSKISKYLRDATSELSKFEAQTSRAFGSLAQFNKANRSIEKIENSLTQAKFAVQDLTFSDLKLDASLLSLLLTFDLALVNIRKLVELVKEDTKNGILGNAKTQDIFGRLDPKYMQKTFDELNKIITQETNKAENAMLKALNALDRATIIKSRKLNRIDDLINNGVSASSIGEAAYKRFFEETKQGILRFNTQYAGKGSVKEDFLKYLKKEFSLTDNDFKDLLEALGKNFSASKVNEVFKNMGTYKGTNIFSKSLNSTTDDNLDALRRALNDEKKAYEELEAIRSQFANSLSDGGAIAKAMSKASEATERVNRQMNELKDSMVEAAKSKFDISNNFTKAETELIRFKLTLQDTNAEFLKMEQRTRTFNSMKMAVTNFMGFYLILNLVKRGVKEAANHIKELDSVMNKISIVTDMSTGDLWNLIDAYSEMALKYGVSIKGAYEVSQIYYQQGLQLKDVLNLTNETLKLSKISGIDYALTTDYMTTALRGFKMEMSDANRVVDVYSNLAAHTAVSSEELAVAMSKTASSMENVGSTFEESSAMIGTMVAVTRESSTNIGSALKSIASRYGELKKDVSALTDEEGLALSYNKVDAALQSVGITLKDTDGLFRSFTDVILELSSVWNQLESTQLRYIATQFAGNRQQSRFLALVGNEELLRLNLKYAKESEDTGDILALKALDSIESKTEQVRVAYQLMYTTVGILDMWKGFLDGAKNVMNTLNILPKAFGKFPIGAAAMIADTIKVIKDLGLGALGGINKIWDRLLPTDVITEKTKAAAQAYKDTFANELNKTSPEIDKSGRSVVERINTAIAKAKEDKNLKGAEETLQLGTLVPSVVQEPVERVSTEVAQQTMEVLPLFNLEEFYSLINTLLGLLPEVLFEAVLDLSSAIDNINADFLPLLLLLLANADLVTPEGLLQFSDAFNALIESAGDKAPQIREAFATASEDAVSALFTALQTNALPEMKINADGDAALLVALSVKAQIESMSVVIHAILEVDKSVLQNVNGNINVNASTGATSAKGNAFAGGRLTLVGELGPEMYVSNGRYYVAGANGPEMINLPDDAIVFNHLLTRDLLKNLKTSTTGKPITNEKNAVAMAGGNFSFKEILRLFDDGFIDDATLKRIEEIKELLLNDALYIKANGLDRIAQRQNAVENLWYNGRNAVWQAVNGENARTDEIGLTHTDHFWANIDGSDIQKESYNAYIEAMRLYLGATDPQLKSYMHDYLFNRAGILSGDLTLDDDWKDKLDSQYGELVVFAADSFRKLLGKGNRLLHYDAMGLGPLNVADMTRNSVPIPSRGGRIISREDYVDYETARLYPNYKELFAGRPLTTELNDALGQELKSIISTALQAEIDKHKAEEKRHEAEKIEQEKLTKEANERVRVTLQETTSSFDVKKWAEDTRASRGTEVGIRDREAFVGIPATLTDKSGLTKTASWDELKAATIDSSKSFEDSVVWNNLIQEEKLIETSLPAILGILRRRKEEADDLFGGQYSDEYLKLELKLGLILSERYKNFESFILDKKVATVLKKEGFKNLQFTDELSTALRDPNSSLYTHLLKAGKGSLADIFRLQDQKKLDEINAILSKKKAIDDATLLYRGYDTEKLILILDTLKERLTEVNSSLDTLSETQSKKLPEVSLEDTQVELEEERALARKEFLDANERFGYTIGSKTEPTIESLEKLLAAAEIEMRKKSGIPITRNDARRLAVEAANEWDYDKLDKVSAGWTTNENGDLVRIPVNPYNKIVDEEAKAHYLDIQKELEAAKAIKDRTGEYIPNLLSATTRLDTLNAQMERTDNAAEGPSNDEELSNRLKEAQYKITKDKSGQDITAELADERLAALTKFRDLLAKGPTVNKGVQGGDRRAAAEAALDTSGLYSFELNGNSSVEYIDSLIETLLTYKDTLNNTTEASNELKEAENDQTKDSTAETSIQDKITALLQLKLARLDAANATTKEEKVAAEASRQQALKDVEKAGYKKNINGPQIDKELGKLAEQLKALEELAAVREDINKTKQDSSAQQASESEVQATEALTAALKDLTEAYELIKEAKDSTENKSSEKSDNTSINTTPLVGVPLLDKPVLSERANKEEGAQKDKSALSLQVPPVAPAPTPVPANVDTTAPTELGEAWTSAYEKLCLYIDKLVELKEISLDTANTFKSQFEGSSLEELNTIAKELGISLKEAGEEGKNAGELIHTTFSQKTTLALSSFGAGLSMVSGLIDKRRPRL